MKAIVEREALVTLTGHVSSVVERRTTIPVLSNARITAADGKLALTATDLDIEIADSLDAQITDPGAITAPVLYLHEIVRRLPEGSEISLSHDNNRLNISAGRARFDLQTLPVDDFPVMDTGDLPHRFTLTAGQIRRLIDKTRTAISSEESRYYLNGIHLHALAEKKPLLRAVATDGHRLARVEVPLPDGAADIPGIIVPRKTATGLRKLIEDADDDADIGIGISQTMIQFSIADLTLTSKLIDGTFPDYQRVIPDSNDKTLVVSGAEFARAVHRVAAVSSERVIPSKLAISKNKLVLTVTSEGNSAVEDLAVSYEGDDMEIGFNAVYLQELAPQFEGEDVRFDLADPGSPVILRDSKDEGVLYVLMPMRV